MRSHSSLSTSHHANLDFTYLLASAIYHSLSRCYLNVGFFSKNLSMGFFAFTIMGSLWSWQVLETCVKNCGRKFHIQVAQKDFLQELIRVISPKGNPPQVVVDKVLGILQVTLCLLKSTPLDFIIEYFKISCFIVSNIRKKSICLFLD